MAFKVDNNGNMQIVQGDSGELVINGIPTDQNYKIYLAVQNSERLPIGDEIMVESHLEPTVVIKMTGNYTNLFVVDEGAKSATYYYGVKMCSEVDNIEDTLILGDNVIGGLNTITVYPRKVEGI
jgi:hypothetical protein